MKWEWDGMRMERGVHGMKWESGKVCMGTRCGWQKDGHEVGMG